VKIPGKEKGLASERGFKRGEKKAPPGGEEEGR